MLAERLVIRGGIVAGGGGAPAPATVVVEAGRVTAVAPAAEPVPASPGDW